MWNWPYHPKFVTHLYKKGDGHNNVQLWYNINIAKSSLRVYKILLTDQYKYIMVFRKGRSTHLVIYIFRYSLVKIFYDAVGTDEGLLSLFRHFPSL